MALVSEKRIAEVQKSRSLIAAETKVDFADAAGFRKPIRFNCISCSRPVELPLRGSLQAQLPAARGVRTKRSKAPYLSYEMDQVIKETPMISSSLLIFMIALILSFTFYLPVRQSPLDLSCFWSHTAKAAVLRLASPSRLPILHLNL